MTEKEIRLELEQLKTANQNKINLISIAAHELRTSLTAVRWSIKMLADNEYGPLNAEQARVLNQAVASSERMIPLIDNLLALNNDNDSSIEYVFQPFDLTSTIKEGIADFSSEAKAKDINIVFNAPEKNIIINGDSQKLRVVIQNLIENALKYSPKGSEILVELEVVDDNAVFRVKDPGIGIPAAEKSQIFEKYYRASNAQHWVKIGSGLGLYATKLIIEKHNGSITFESSENSTVFTVSVPIGLSTA